MIPYRTAGAPSSHLLQPKSDLSDFGHVYVAKPGKPDFARGEGVKRSASLKKQPDQFLKMCAYLCGDESAATFSSP
jgi:hypothetical protein